MKVSRQFFFCLVCSPLEKKKLIRPNLACGCVPGTVYSVCMCSWCALMQVLLLPVGRGFMGQCLDIGAHDQDLVIGGRVPDSV